jgi:hypothetical protein
MDASSLSTMEVERDSSTGGAILASPDCNSATAFAHPANPAHWGYWDTIGHECLYL